MIKDNILEILYNNVDSIYIWPNSFNFKGNNKLSVERKNFDTSAK